MPGGIGCEVKQGVPCRGARLSLSLLPFALLLLRQIGGGNHHSQQRANRDDRLGVHGKHPLSEMLSGRMRRSTLPIVECAGKSGRGYLRVSFRLWTALDLPGSAHRVLLDNLFGFKPYFSLVVS